MNYLVVVSTYHPYKIEQSFTEKASTHSVAISRAIKRFRQSDRMKGRKLKEIAAKATQL